MRVRIYNSQYPQWDGETGKIVGTRQEWFRDETRTIALVNLDAIALQVEFALSELSELP